MREGDLIDLKELYIDYHLHDADGPSVSTDNSGSSYVILVAGGIKKEGADFPFICASESEAIGQYYKSLIEWLGKRRIIIWRIRPELVVFTIKGGKKISWIRHYQVYSRLTAY